MKPQGGRRTVLRGKVTSVTYDEGGHFQGASVEIVGSKDALLLTAEAYNGHAALGSVPPGISLEEGDEVVCEMSRTTPNFVDFWYLGQEYSWIISRDAQFQASFRGVA